MKVPTHIMHGDHGIKVCKNATAWLLRLLCYNNHLGIPRRKWEVSRKAQVFKVILYLSKYHIRAIGETES